MTKGFLDMKRLRDAFRHYSAEAAQFVTRELGQGSLRDMLVNNSRYENERYFEKESKSQYLGNKKVLCKILGKFKFFTFADDIGFSSNVIMDGYWEYWLTKYFAMAVKNGDTVLDIGANLGYYSIIAADLVGSSGKVVSVEPNPAVYSLLSSNLEINGFGGRAEARNFALAGAGETGCRPFFVPTGEPKNGRFLEPGEDAVTLGQYGDVFDVEIGALRAEAFERVDFIKVDVEGAELMVLEHIRPIIERFKPSIVCEVNFSRGYDYNDLKDIIGTNKLMHLNFDSSITELTKSMTINERINDDWLLVVV